MAAAICTGRHSVCRRRQSNAPRLALLRNGATWPRSASRNVVTDPQSTSFALFDGFESERHRFAVRVGDTVEQCRNLVASVDAGEQQQADFIHQPSLQKGTIDVTSA